MSKVDAQRAMREAKYAASRASGPTRREAAAAAGAPPADGAAAPAPVARRSAPRPTPTAEAAPAVTSPEPGLCGHKSMNGRACTREAGHPQKSHRYG